MNIWKCAKTDYPIHRLLSDRWSPTAFSSRPVPDEDLRSLFEAVRWTASSYNEQPWRYILATQADHEGFERMLSCRMVSQSAAPGIIFRVWTSQASFRCQRVRTCGNNSGQSRHTSSGEYSESRSCSSSCRTRGSPSIVWLQAAIRERAPETDLAHCAATMLFVLACRS
jgi:nitroreductase